jgi:Zn-dependent protease
MAEATPGAGARRCAGCGSELAPALRACPACRRLVHAAELASLAREAEGAAASGALSDAAAAWRRVLDLLPPEAAQGAQVRARLEELSRRIEREGGSAAAAPAAAGVAGGAGRRLAGPAGAAAALALLAWKLKALVLLALSKGKLVLLGLTKAPTLLSMLASLGVYWAAWGWKFAAGVVASLYVHEMGHVVALRRYGIAASAPMFVPGLGAFIRARQYPSNPREDARVGLAGPLWGLGAAAAAYAAHLATGAEGLAAIARAGAWINLFNLLPVGTLDGGRGFRSFTRAQRGLAAAALGAAWLATGEGLLLLLLVAAAVRALAGRAAADADWAALAHYVGLAALLAAASRIPVGI